MTEFTPLMSTLGGALIGFSALLIMLFYGRIAGISGILSKTLPPWKKGEAPNWQLPFLIGLIIAPILYQSFSVQPIIQDMSEDKFLMISAGLIVGVGTGIGSGCTSGHGVCGISRLSKRSFIATLTFMAAGFLTVYITRHIMGGLT